MTPDHPHEHDSREQHSHDHHEHRSGWRGLLDGVLRPHSHDPSDSVDDALESSSRGLRTLALSLAVLLVTGLVQAAVALSSGSVALLADTVHNLADALTAIPLGVAFWLGRRPPGPRHPYGHGRAEDLAGLFILLLIALSAVLAGYEAVRRLVAPSPVDHLGWVAAAGVVGFVGNELVAVYRIRVGRAIGSAALVADGVHARTDGLTSLAVVVGTAGVALGVSWADPVVGLLITVAICAVLRGTARDVFGRLMDAVDPELERVGRAALAAEEEVRSVAGLRMRWSGHQLLADAVLEIDPALSVVQADAVVVRARERLSDALPKMATAVLAVHPAPTPSPLEQAGPPSAQDGGPDLGVGR